ncbi:MAG: DUF3108 domain-containing protein [Saprospiraceae bacterium]|nr:DUF3108 domain-containing protein [Saprospiraceae bacterium]
MNLLKKMKPIAFLTFVAATLILFAFRPSSSTIDFSAHKSENDVFQSGEELVYKIYYNWQMIWIPAGEVVFNISESKDHYEMVAKGKTYKSYDKIFKVNDYYYSKIDKKTLLPRNFVRIIEEGSYKIYDSIAFDQLKYRAMSFHGSDKNSTKPTSHQLDGSVHDLISNIYSLRNQSVNTLYKGDIIPIRIFFDKEKYPLNIRYEGKEQKTIKDFGTFNTLRLHPELVAGNVFKKGDQMSVWVSDDQNRIPLLIESPLAVGSVKAVLKSTKGLKYNMTAKLND